MDNLLNGDTNNVQPLTNDPQTVGDVGVQNTPNTVAQNPESVTPTEPTKYNIDGVGEFTADEIKEMKNAGLRQADYTKKTQEIARVREENSQAIELFDYIRANPHLIEALREAEGQPSQYTYSATPENAMLQDVMYKQQVWETNMKIDSLKNKYGDFDEVALLNEASRLQTDDFEGVYKMLNYKDPATLEAEVRQKVLAELEQNKGAVNTTVTTQQPINITPNVSLTQEQLQIAEVFGMTPEEYINYM